MKKFILFLITFIAHFGILFSMEKKKDLQIPFKGDPVTIHGKTYDIHYLGSTPLKRPETKEEVEKWIKSPNNPFKNSPFLSAFFQTPQKRFSQRLYTMIKSHPIKFLGLTAIVGISTYCLRNHLKTAFLSLQKNAPNLNELFYRKIKTIFCNTTN